MRSRESALDVPINAGQRQPLHYNGTCYTKMPHEIFICQHVGAKELRVRAGLVVRVGPQGRIVIPAAVREELGLGVGDELSTRVEDGRLVLERREDVARRLRNRFASVAPGRSLSEELIAERREEARTEAREADEERSDGPADA